MSGVKETLEASLAVAKLEVKLAEQKVAALEAMIENGISEEEVSDCIIGDLNETLPSFSCVFLRSTQSA